MKAHGDDPETVKTSVKREVTGITQVRDFNRETATAKDQRSNRENDIIQKLLNSGRKEGHTVETLDIDK